MNNFLIKLILWALPINLGLSFWVGLRELGVASSPVVSELEAVGLALLLSVPLLSGWLIYRIFPANRSWLRSTIRFISVVAAVLYAPVITWLNVSSLLTGKPLEEGFQVYVLPTFFGAASLVAFFVMFFLCTMFTNRPDARYNPFD